MQMYVWAVGYLLGEWGCLEGNAGVCTCVSSVWCIACVSVCNTCASLCVHVHCMEGVYVCICGPRICGSVCV